MKSQHQIDNVIHFFQLLIMTKLKTKAAIEDRAGIVVVKNFLTAPT